MFFCTFMILHHSTCVFVFSKLHLTRSIKDTEAHALQSMKSNMQLCNLILSYQVTCFAKSYQLSLVFVHMSTPWLFMCEPVAFHQQYSPKGHTLAHVCTHTSTAAETCNRLWRKRRGENTKGKKKRNKTSKPHVVSLS